MTSFIQNITSADKTILQKTLSHWRPQSKNYEDSWGYIIQATRNMGGRWYDPATQSLVFFGRKPLDKSTLVISNFFAEPKHLKSIIEELCSTLNISQTVLKNINPQDIKKFTPYGFREYYDNEQWDDFSRFDDQTYPQLMIDLQKVKESKGLGYAYLRKIIHKNSRAHIRPYKGSDREGVFAIFTALDGTTAKSYIEQSQGMYYNSHSMYPSAGLDKYVVIDEAINEIVGFTATSTITTKTAAFAALIFKPNAEVSPVWGAYQVLLMLYQKGFQQINVGGSETEGTYFFKHRTFRPVEELQKTHLVYE